LSPEQRKEIRDLLRQGFSVRATASQVGHAQNSVIKVMNAERAGVASIDDWLPIPGRLGMNEREEIALGLARGETYTDLARVLGFSVSTVSREVAANGGRKGYRPWAAHQAAFAAARRSKPTKLASNTMLRDRVAELLIEWWSPEQIAERLRREHPQDPMMWVSHETIYQTLYVQGRGELRRELAAYLRSGRDRRQPQGKSRLERRGRIADMVNISERPPEVEDRAVPGHWEGDLIMGRANRSAVGTLVERSTRFVVLLHLAGGFDPPQVRDAMIDAVRALPEVLRGSITWDQGFEMRRHIDFTVTTGVQIYFCDPHKPWQRGSNENTNGLLRQYMPKGTDLSVHTKTDLDRFAKSLNGRPRKTLNWMTPSEKLAEVLATTT
jgi:IS30 family transposase